jgi:serine/threonine-protein kinase RsbW/stage II sporulation protein AB (anti-sigma F factor)
MPLNVDHSIQRWSLPAVPAAVACLRTAVGAFASGAGVANPPLADVRLAVSEAVTNAVIHSYRDDPEPGPVDVAAEVGDEGLRIVVSDRGLGFGPRTDSPGAGMGLPIIAAVADRFEIRRRLPAGTEVHICFDLRA